MGGIIVIPILLVLLGVVLHFRSKRAGRESSQALDRAESKIKVFRDRTGL